MKFISLSRWIVGHECTGPYDNRISVVSMVINIVMLNSISSPAAEMHVELKQYLTGIYNCV